MSTQLDHSRVVCALHELAGPGTREFSMGEGDWPLRGFVVRHQNQVRAYINSCPHARLPLNFTPNEFFAPHVQLLQCTVHGALFEPGTGVCVAGPCVGQRLRTLDVEIIDGYIYLRSHPDTRVSC